jgi:hypothetical protein
MASFLFIVSANEPGTYAYLKYGVARRSGDVIFDRRKEERRQTRQGATMTERRYCDRRHRDITRELQAFGWALVNPSAQPLAEKRRETAHSPVGRAPFTR